MKLLCNILVFCLCFLLSLDILHTQWRCTSGPYGSEITCFIMSGKNLFAGLRFGVFLSTDNGKIRTEVNDGLTSTYIRAFAVNDKNLFVGTYVGGVFRTTDYGKNWTEVNNGLTSNIVLTLAVSGTNLFAGTYGEGVFLSTDNGETWIEFNDGLKSSYVSNFTIIDTFLFAGLRAAASGGDHYRK